MGLTCRLTSCTKIAVVGNKLFKTEVFHSMWKDWYASFTPTGFSPIGFISRTEDILDLFSKVGGNSTAQTVPWKCKKLTVCSLSAVCTVSSNQTSYLSRTHGRCPWRKNLSCGENLNFCTWQMWNNLKFLYMWINFTFHHMTDVEKSEISFIMCTIYGILLHFTLFCCKTFCFFCDLRCFCNLRAIMWRKL